jgi:CRISPR system Cascade subunit CasE
MFITVVKHVQGDDYTIHQILARRFQGQKILFQRRKESIHVLSPRPPAGRNGSTVEIKRVLDGIRIGDSLDFILRINPVVAKKDGSEPVKRGRRKAVPCNDLKRWLDNKFIQYGFLADYAFDEEGFRESVKQGSVITINSLLVKGTIEVLNPDGVRRALTEGIGRAKRLGFGMIHCYDSLVLQAH